jgi:ribonuclease BN (tRNA processing enzyme)
MLGFEVIFNEETVRLAINSGIMEVIFTSGGLDNNEMLYIFGHTSFHKFRYSSPPLDANKITVRIADIDSNSESIQKENRFKDDAEMLQYYYEVKQYLEKEGLL